MMKNEDWPLPSKLWNSMSAERQTARLESQSSLKLLLFLVLKTHFPTYFNHSPAKEERMTLASLETKAKEDNTFIAELQVSMILLIKSVWIHIKILNFC